MYVHLHLYVCMYVYMARGNFKGTMRSSYPLRWRVYYGVNEFEVQQYPHAVPCLKYNYSILYEKFVIDAFGTASLSTPYAPYARFSKVVAFSLA